MALVRITFRNRSGKLRQTAPRACELAIVRNPGAKMAEQGFADEMFGGVCFLLHGNMACGIINDDVIVRVGKEVYESALALPYTRKFDITGKAMTGWVMVSPQGHASDEDLDNWLQKGIDFTMSLPRK